MTESVVSTCEAAGIDLAALPAAPPAPRRTLVLSGGGGRGAWQVGACEHLILERGYGFDLIAGVSAGAVNGATLAQAHDHDELEAELEHLRSVWFGLRGNHDIYRSRPLGRVRMVLGRHPGVYEPGPLREILLEHIDPSRVATSPVQLRVGYVDLVTGRYRTAGNDDAALRDAVLASCSLPVAFPPVALRNGRELGVDGGVRSISPLLDALAALAERPPAPGGDEVWVILTHPLRRRQETQIQSWLTVARRCVSLLTDESLPEDLARVRQISDLLRSEAMPDGGRDVRLRVVHPQQRLDGPTLDFTPARLRARYEDGLRTARAGAAVEV